MSDTWFFEDEIESDDMQSQTSGSNQFRSDVNLCSLYEMLSDGDIRSLEEELSSSDPYRIDSLIFDDFNGYSANRKPYLFDTHLSEDDDTSPENSYKNCSRSPGSDFSPSETLTSESNCHPPHRKHKLSSNGLSEEDRSAVPCVKRRLTSSESFKTDLLFPSTYSVSEWFFSHFRDGNDKLTPDILLELAGGCEKMLRRIIRTAYQFTRHSHREKLTLKDMERAFKIHNVDIGSDCLVDQINVNSSDDGDASQQFTCTGKWLRKLRDMSLNG